MRKVLSIILAMMLIVMATALAYASGLETGDNGLVVTYDGYVCEDAASMYCIGIACLAFDFGCIVGLAAYMVGLKQRSSQ